MNVGVVWDAENQLVEVKQGPTTLASFTYDGLGRRQRKIAGGVTHTYIADEDDLIEARVGTGQTLRYVEGSGIDQHLATQDGSGVTYYVADHLGSVVQATNSAGAVTLARNYDPWGNMLSGTSAGGWAFTGREWDSEVGLYYYRARYYDAKIGRFLSEDPLHWLDKPNLYPYVGSDPISFVDPTGEARFQNNSGRPIPYKPEGEDGTIKLCLPGEPCDVDGVYPPACNDYPVKVVDGCTAEATPDGKLVIICPFYDGNAPTLKRKFPRLGQRLTGGPTNKDFHEQHKDWVPPNNQPNCGCQ